MQDADELAAAIEAFAKAEAYEEDPIKTEMVELTRVYQLSLENYRTARLAEELAVALADEAERQLVRAWKAVCREDCTTPWTRRRPSAIEILKEIDG